MRVRKVKIVKLGTPEPVGDITVPGLHNFVLGGGQAVSNSDSDVDGSHIAVLLIAFFLRFMLPLVQDGRLYIAVLPRYVAKTAGKRVFADTYDEVMALAKKKGMSKPLVTYFKGLGEMQAGELAETALMPATRRLVQITADRSSVEYLTKLLGTGGTFRKVLLGLV